MRNKEDIKNEAAILDALNKGDQTAISMLYDGYATALFALLRKMTNNKDIAESALQACFVTMWQSKHTYNPANETLFSWLFDIACVEAKLTGKRNEAKSKNQVETYYVDDFKYKEIKKSIVLMELILFGRFSQNEAATRMGITLTELRKLIRQEINKYRAIPAE